MSLSIGMHAACAELVGKGVDEVEFKLIYNSTVDGVCARTFHDSCDDLNVPTLTLVEGPYRDFVVGGYTAVPWRGNDNKFTIDPSSFLFKLHRPQANAAYRVQMYPPVSAAAGVYSGSSHGPVFGRGKLTVLLATNTDVKPAVGLTDILRRNLCHRL